MRVIYDLAFIIFGIVYLPYLILTKRYRYGMGNRFGILSKRLKSISSKNRVIWIHAVSVGEMKAASILAPFLRKTFPSHTLIFSSVTHTGNKIARTIATGEEEVFYLPIDVSFIVDRVVNIIKPELFLCLETELWPNLISSLYRVNAKIILVNGRISNRSYFGYKKIRFAISPILSKFSVILMQSEEDRVRIRTLGAPKEKVFVTGNLKFDLPLSEPASQRRQIRESLKIDDQDILLIAGSTHRGEEEQLLGCFSRLKKEYSNLRFLIAPRHVERAQEIIELLRNRGFKSVMFSALSSLNLEPRASSAERVIILDVIGVLKTVYSASDIVFVGGSLVKKGGQNPIEPASIAKPIILGKFTFNFQDVVKSFLENGACIQVKNKDELYSAVRSLIDDSEERKSLGISALGTVTKNSGSSQRTIDLILSICRP
ncbi:3-deoxy-D-manno-octulosonic acid transferase [Candidatus Omnitrophota bacterium]